MYDTLIFDLDGTLLNTLPDLTDSVNFVMRKHSFPVHSEDIIRQYIGNGIPALIKRSLPKNTSEEVYKFCLDEMMDYYGSHSLVKTKPYDGITELLKILKDKNIKTAVITNKAEKTAVKLCKAVFGDAFNSVTGDDGNIRLKPFPDSCLKTLKALNSQKDKTLLIGDSDVDILTAHNAGIKAAGALWGFRDEKTLKDSGAEYLASRPLDILDFLRRGY